MWIVLLALRRPYTFIVLALLLPLLGALTLLGTPLRAGMPTDIFPDIRIPVIAITFNTPGMPPDEMAGRITGQIERYATTIINDIEHVESQTLSRRRRHQAVLPAGRGHQPRHGAGRRRSARSRSSRCRRALSRR